MYMMYHIKFVKMKFLLGYRLYRMVLCDLNKNFIDLNFELSDSIQVHIEHGTISLLIIRAKS